MEEALKIIVAFVGLVVYYWRPRWFFIFWFVSVPLISPFLTFFSGITDLDETVKMVRGGYFMHLNMFVLLDSFLRNKKRNLPLSGILLAFIILTLYLFFQSFATNGGLQYAYGNIKSLVILLLPLLILLFNEKTRPELQELYIVVWIFLVIETFSVFLNFAGIRFYAATYILLFSLGEKLATGTFFSTQMFCNYITTIYLFICIDYFYRKQISMFMFAILTTMSVFCLLSGGSKLCIILAVLSFSLSLFLYQRKHRILLVVLIAILYFGMNALLSFKGGDISSNEGINRIVNELSLFTQSKKDGAEDNTSTLSLSEKLLESYFYRSPFIGNGLSAQGDDFTYDVDVKNNNTARNMKADAKLAFLLVDIGLIGVLLYLFFFYQQFKCIARFIKPKGKKALLIAFVFYFLFALTESGFWDVLLYPVSYIYFYALIENEQNVSRKVVMHK